MQTQHTVKTTDERDLTVSSEDRIGFRDLVMLTGDRDDEHLPFQFSMYPWQARELASRLWDIAELAEARRQKEAAA
jgi:hypothetical protein